MNAGLKSTLRNLFCFFLIGFVVVLGMRAAEYLIDRPPSRLLICIADDDHLLGNCKPFEDYLTPKGEGDD